MNYLTPGVQRKSNRQCPNSVCQITMFDLRKSVKLPAIRSTNMRLLNIAFVESTKLLSVNEKYYRINNEATYWQAVDVSKFRTIHRRVRNESLAINMIAKWVPELLYAIVATHRQPHQVQTSLPTENLVSPYHSKSTIVARQQFIAVKFQVAILMC